MAGEAINVGDIYDRIGKAENANARLDEKVDGIVSSITDIQSTMHTIANGSRVPYIPIIMIILGIVVPGAVAFNVLESMRGRALQQQIDTRSEAVRYQQEIIVRLSAKHQEEEVATAFDRGMMHERTRWLESATTGNRRRDE